MAVAINGSGSITGVPGAVVQVASTTQTAAFSTSSTSYVDWTNASVTITPKSANNKVLVIYSASGSMGAAGPAWEIAAVRGSTVIREVGMASTGNGYTAVVSSSYLDSPNTTSATTYKLQAKVSGGTLTGGNAGVSLTVMEVAA